MVGLHRQLQMQNDGILTPLACVPGGIPETDRAAHFALSHRLFGSELRERRDIPNGYEFRFLPDALPEISTFIQNERKCCPFLSFQLTISPSNGPIWLRVDGPEGTRLLLESELGRVAESVSLS